MELLIIKSNDQYLRVTPDEFFLVGLDKASVFPMDRLYHVKTCEKEAIKQGYKDIRIKKLILSEEDL